MQAESKFLIEHWIHQEAKNDKTALLVASIHYCGFWILIVVVVLLLGD